MPDDDFESRILGFEQAWQRNEPCEIADVLDHLTALTSPERYQLLVELICIDLEFRWRDGSPSVPADRRVTLESYSANFPELGPLDQMSLLLVGEEYRARRQWGDRPSHSDFVSRFRARQEEIRAELVSIDRELEEESPDSSSICRPAVEIPMAQDLPDQLRASNFTRFSRDRLGDYDWKRCGIRSRVPCFVGPTDGLHEAVNRATDVS